MPERFAVLSGGPVSTDGRHLLILPDDTTELVEPDVTDDELIARYELDSVVRAPKIDVRPAICLDGPLAGQKTVLATNELGYRHEVYLPPRPGGPTVKYEIVRLSQGGRPAELRFIETDEAT